MFFAAIELGHSNFANARSEIFVEIAIVTSSMAESFSESWDS